MRDEGDQGSAGGDGDAGVVLDAESLGGLMIGQLFDLLESWTKMLEAVAQQGVDPTPLLRSLASTLRNAADQLDPLDPLDPLDRHDPPE